MTDPRKLPRTIAVPAARLRVGDIVVESADHHAEVTRISISSKGVTVDARYVWTPQTDPAWRLGVFAPSARLLVVVSK